MASKPQDLRLDHSNKHGWPPVTQALNPFGKHLHSPMVVLQLHKWTCLAWHVGNAAFKTRGRVRSSATILTQSV